MTVVPIYVDIPDDILAGLVTGDLMRFGTVVRDSKEIIAHLPEVDRLPEADESLASTAHGSALGNEKLLIGLGIAAVAAAGTALTFYLIKRRRRSKSEIPTCVASYNASLVAYLAAVQDGTLDAGLVDRMISALEAVKEETDSGNMTIELSVQQSEALIGMFATYIRMLAEANSLEVGEILESTPPLEVSPIVDLRRYLEAQREIFRRSA